ncbi:otubain [Trifolium medium]|uniref:Otubain n=1 Tax=Trifolium medium TaxID=97028 RepID=A0A392M3T3_9FABA|nr:otubain [Trifolium medium]
MHEYYTDIADVDGDGHCRFRAVSVLLGKPEDSYNLVKYTVVVLAGNGGYSETYFPLEGVPTASDKLMCLGWVNGNHFLVIRLKPGCPIPPTSLMWDRHCLGEAVKWPGRYIHRMSAYNTLKRVHDGIVVEDYVPRPKLLLDLATKEESIVPETFNLAED